jgi:hypothetical protein
MLTVEQFNKLTLPEKLEILEQDDAVYLEHFYYAGSRKITLFLLYGSIYVSVHYDRQTDRISKANAFTEYSKLDAYIQNIDLKEIYALLG